MTYVKCYDCNTTIHFTPVDVIEFNKRFVEKNEAIYCFSCFKKQEEKKNNYLEPR